MNRKKFLLPAVIVASLVLLLTACEGKEAVTEDDAKPAPEETLTRGMPAAVLCRMAGRPVVANTPVFKDVTGGAWCSDAVSWAAENGVISGYGGDTFGVNDPTTREQAVAILWRYAGNPESGTGTADNL